MLLKAVALIPVVAIVVYGPADEVARSSVNPVSFVELSVHARLICDEDTTEAVKPVGAVGSDAVADGVVALTGELE